MRWQARLPSAHPPAAAWAPLRLLGQEPAVILNLCCGRRRAGDIQYHVENLVRDGRAGNRDVVVISVDVALDPVKGNLASVGTIVYWVDHVLRGRVVGFLGGPPLRDVDAREGRSRGGPKCSSQSG